MQSQSEQHQGAAISSVSDTIFLDSQNRRLRTNADLIAAALSEIELTNSGKLKILSILLEDIVNEIGEKVQVADSSQIRKVDVITNAFSDNISASIGEVIKLLSNVKNVSHHTISRYARDSFCKYEIQDKCTTFSSEEVTTADFNAKKLWEEKKKDILTESFLSALKKEHKEKKSKKVESEEEVSESGLPEVDEEAKSALKGKESSSDKFEKFKNRLKAEANSSGFNAFMKAELERLKTENPSEPIESRKKKAVNAWRNSLENPKFRRETLDKLNTMILPISTIEGAPEEQQELFLTEFMKSDIRLIRKLLPDAQEISVPLLLEALKKFKSDVEKYEPLYS